MGNQTEIRIVRYQVDGEKSCDNVGNLAVYTWFGDDDMVVFSGTRNQDRVSTADAAINVVAAICEVEQVVPEKIKFFDLRTRRGYQNFKSGEYQFVKILTETDKATGHVYLTGFEGYVPSKEMLQAFQPFLFKMRPPVQGSQTERRAD
jgi:hypothetical protein